MSLKQREFILTSTTDFSENVPHIVLVWEQLSVPIAFLRLCAVWQEREKEEQQ